MPKRFRPFLSAAIRFFQTSSLARAVLGLLALAMVLLLLVNLTVFVMVRRTIAFNETVDHTQQARLTAQQVLDVPDDVPSRLGLTEAVSPLRLRGMAGMLARIKRQIRAGLVP